MSDTLELPSAFQEMYFQRQSYVQNHRRISEQTYQRISKRDDAEFELFRIAPRLLVTI